MYHVVNAPAKLPSAFPRIFFSIAPPPRIVPQKHLGSRHRLLPVQCATNDSYKFSLSGVTSPSFVSDNIAENAVLLR